MTSLYEQLAKPKPKHAIRIDRSTLDNYANCSFWCKAQLCAEIWARYQAKYPYGSLVEVDYSDQWWLDAFDITMGDIPDWCREVLDFDADRPRNVGVEFHRIMEEYISELLNNGEARNPEWLKQLALAGDARLQPELLHLAKLTGARISVWLPSYIAHEQQYSYRITNMGPKGEDVVLTTRLDLVQRGNNSGEIRIPDWKTGWGKDFHLQPMFCSVVTWRYIENVEHVTWQPFFCRKGTWGKRYEYDLEDLKNNELIVKQAVSQMLTEEEWAPQPGTERCRYCPANIKQHCHAEKRYGDIDTDRTAFAGATEKLQTEVASRIAVMKADCEANGPIQVDDHYWGKDVINKRPSFKRNKGKPGWLGDDEGDDDAD